MARLEFHITFQVIYHALALPSALEQPLAWLSMKTAALVLTLTLEMPSGLIAGSPGWQSALLSI